ncbi:hypothetical protein BASA82_000657 [Batrachochytrium salamandrivorans]|nr:hypothetical protein BASA82_000657 [Batrachochytrium salamandrivorans]
MFLLPEWFPFHPGKTWCHARMVSLPMAYLYGRRFVYPECDTDPTILQLRVEIYPCDPFSKQSMFSPMAPGEVYAAPPSPLLQLGDFFLRRLVEPLLFKPLQLRKLAEARTLRLIREEDETNEYICIGPVNKAMNMVCRFAAGDAVAVKKHADTMYRYLWVAEDGMKMNGYLNSMVWDSSFCLRALASLPNKDAGLVQFADENLAFLLRNQVDKDPSATQQFRDPHCKGGWGFSTRRTRTFVSDCTGEALLAILSYAPQQSVDKVLGPAVDLILWMQNSRWTRPGPRTRNAAGTLGLKP